MSVRQLVLAYSVLLLAGCNSAEDKIVDLSAGVFLVFVALVAVKYGSPIIAQTSVFIYFARLIESHYRAVVGFLYVVAGLLISSGFILAGIHRIHVFIGFVVAVVAIHVRSLADPGSEEKRKLSIEIISLGFGVVFVLASLWFFGTDLFRGL